MCLVCVIEKCISGEFIDIVDSNVARKYARASEMSPTMGVYILIPWLNVVPAENV